MGYESKLYIVKEYEPYIEGELGCGDLVAVFDLSKMGYEKYNGKSFSGLFNQERTCKIYAVDSEIGVPDKCYRCKTYEKRDTLITRDCYGANVKKADMNELIAWLQEMLKDEFYWRAKVLLETLLEIKKCEPENGASVSVYHYGY